jgi:hypothetical protein
MIQKLFFMKAAFIFFTCFCMLSASSQVILKLQLPQSGLTLKSQLWNLSVINTSSADANIQIEMLMTDVTTNQRVLSATSRTQTISKGLHVFTANNVVPVTYNLLSSSFNIGTSQEGFLPIGTFEVCYTIVSLQNEDVERMSEECATIEVEPLSPPILILPGDNDTIETRQPLFTWLPPSPANLFTNLSYDFLLTEVAQTQSGPDAVQQNLPHFSKSHILSNNLPYAPSYPALDTARTYAWQILARSNGAIVGKSDVWTFNLKRNQPLRTSSSGSDYYAKLKKEVDASFTICYDILNFSYANEINDKEIPFKIFDITDSRREATTQDNAPISIQYGDNYKKLDVGLYNLKNKHIYLLELTNSRNENWYLKFEYRK